jgi:hypothetical protein
MASYKSSAETTNYARLCRVVVELCRDLLWESLLPTIPTNTNLDAEITKHIHMNTLRLLPEEEAKLKPKCTREGCDTSILYKLLRFITSIIPTHGWYTASGKNPNLKLPGPSDVSTGDDVERIHQIRNILYGHVTTAQVSDVDFRLKCQEVKSICMRVDAALKHGSQYEHALNEMETECMDPVMEHTYREKFKGQKQQIEEHDQTLHEHTMTLDEHQLRLDEGYQKLKEHDHTLGEQKQTLTEQGKTVGEQGKQVEEQGKKVEEQGQKVEEHGKKVEEQGKKVDEQGKKVEEQGMQVDEHENKISHQKRKIESQEKKVAKHNHKLKRFKHNFEEQQQKDRMVDGRYKM